MAAPITPQPIPYRACVRQLSGPFRPLAQGSMADSGTRQSVNARLAVTEARIESLPCSSEDVNPLVPFSTKNPRIPSGVRAQQIATSATVPLVIQVFSPLITQSLPSFTALVAIPAGFDPKPGSVSPKQPSASPFAILGSQRSFCSSVPYVRIGYITNAPCTDTKLRSPLSP